MKDGLKFTVIFVVLGLFVFLFLYSPHFNTYTYSTLSNITSSTNNASTSNTAISENSVLNFYNKTKNLNESAFINLYNTDKNNSVIKTINSSKGNITADMEFLWTQIKYINNVTKSSLNKTSRIYSTLSYALQTINQKK